MKRLALLCMAVAMVACTGERGPPGPQGVEGPTGPKGDKGDKGDPGPFLSPNGCSDGTVEQTWTATMVGCNYATRSDGGVIPLAVRGAMALCAAGWHVCDANEWQAQRSTTLSNANRYIRARMTCNGCNGDVIVDSATADLCEYSAGGCNTSYAFFVGPTEQDAFCGSTWPTGINNGNVGRIAEISNADANLAKSYCLGASGLAVGSTASIAGTLCCK